MAQRVPLLAAVLVATCAAAAGYSAVAAPTRISRRAPASRRISRLPLMQDHAASDDDFDEDLIAAEPQVRARPRAD